MPNPYTESGCLQIHKNLRKNYEHAWQEYNAYLKAKEEPPKQIRQQYQNALADLQVFLDKNFGKMTPGRWIYDNADKCTWKYLDVRIDNHDKNNHKYNGSILNSEFAYE